MDDSWLLFDEARLHPEDPMLSNELPPMFPEAGNLLIKPRALLFSPPSLFPKAGRLLIEPREVLIGALTMLLEARRLLFGTRGRSCKGICVNGFWFWFSQ
jgi:hypothetical protein